VSRLQESVVTDSSKDLRRSPDWRKSKMRMEATEFPAPPPVMDKGGFGFYRRDLLWLLHVFLLFNEASLRE